MTSFPECGEPFHPDACEPEDYGYDPETGDPFDVPDWPMGGGGDGHPTEQAAFELHDLGARVARRADADRLYLTLARTLGDFERAAAGLAEVLRQLRAEGGAR